jgi:transposase-like protein
MLYIRFPLSLRNVEDPLHERGIEISQETVRHGWNRLGPMFAANIAAGAWKRWVPTASGASTKEWQARAEW